MQQSFNVSPNTSGKWLGSRQIRCNWATKGASASDEKQSSDSKIVVELINGSSGEIEFIYCVYSWSWL